MDEFSVYMFWKTLVQSRMFYDSGIFPRCHISLMNVMKYLQTKYTNLNSRRLRCYIRHCGTGGKLRKLGVCNLCMSTCHDVQVRSYHWILLYDVIKKRLFIYILTLKFYNVWIILSVYNVFSRLLFCFHSRLKTVM